MRETNKTRVVKYLKEYGSITPIQAIQDLGNTRLAATIFELKDLGWDIETESLRVKNRFGRTTNVAKYSLKSVEY
jgi:hypothetical protein